MKKLQNNFTNINQIIRLLELGVPANSADCTLKKCIEDGGYSVYWTAYIEDFIGPVKVDSILPCWSVGRLIEIMKICAKPKEQATMAEEMLYCEDLVELLVYMIEVNKQVIDFSKLNEL